jgi:hypothetical protein
VALPVICSATEMRLGDTCSFICTGSESIYAELQMAAAKKCPEHIPKEDPWFGTTLDQS